VHQNGRKADSYFPIIDSNVLRIEKLEQLELKLEGYLQDHQKEILSLAESKHDSESANLESQKIWAEIDGLNYRLEEAKTYTVKIENYVEKYLPIKLQG